MHARHTETQDVGNPTHCPLLLRSGNRTVMEQADKEVRALWTEVFGVPPSAEVDSGAILQRLVEGLPPLTYDRFAHPALEDGNLVWPVRSEAGRAPNRP